MKRQKRIALINDITGFGRCSITVELPLISALKIQACPLPTAILSVHTGFSSHYLDDYTDRMNPYLESWEKNDLEFDGICTGFLGSAAQIDIVIDFIHRFRNAGGVQAKILVDPVMGDHGKLYASYTEEMCEKMKRLLAHADLVTPNLTEACRLLDLPYPENGEISEENLANMAEHLSAEGPRQVVITGLSIGESIANYLYEDGRGRMLCTPRVGADRSGTGDAFAAIVSAELIRGKSLQYAVEKAADFIYKCLCYAEELNLPWNHGLPFEEYLTELN